jgi:hypothetical protein
MKNPILKIILVLNSIILAVPLLAFPGDPDGGDDPPFEDPTPIDQGFLILLLAGVILIFIVKHKKIRLSRK